QFPVTVWEVLLRTPALRHVAHDSKHSHRPSRFVVTDKAAVFDNRINAVRLPEQVLAGPDLSLVPGCVFKTFLDAGLVVRVNMLLPPSMGAFNWFVRGKQRLKFVVPPNLLGIDVPITDAVTSGHCDEPK